MCKVTRREMIFGGAALAGLTMKDAKAFIASRPEIDKADQLAPEVYFHEGNLVKGHCNNGWIIFEDYVLVIDANFPSGAAEILPKIRSMTDKPIRFAFDTHHHGDHAYGNQVWIDNGATPIAHTGVVEELKRYETGYYGGKPGRWEDTAKSRPDVAASKLKPPSVLFPREMVFDDGKHRVELMHLGVAHTHGDAFAWLPKERILFTGDACVNGPYNYVGDGDTGKWIPTLEAARKLGARIICPGHGPRGVETVLADQQKFFTSLRSQVGALVKAKKSGQEIRDSIDKINSTLAGDAQIARYVGKGNGFASQVEKVYTEMTGNALPAAKKATNAARNWHAQSHGLESLA